MSTSSLPAKAVTLVAVFATIGVLGWAKWIWLRRWWDTVNHPAARPGNTQIARTQVAPRH